MSLDLHVLLATDDDIFAAAFRRARYADDYNVERVSPTARGALARAVRKAERESKTVLVVGSRAWDPHEVVDRIAPDPERIATVTIVPSLSTRVAPSVAVYSVVHADGSLDVVDAVSAEVMNAHAHLRVLRNAAQLARARSWTTVSLRDMPRKRFRRSARVLPMFEARS